MQISCGVSAQLISAIVFATQIVQSFFVSNRKFQASSLLLSLYRLVCVRPGRKLRLVFFLGKGSLIDDVILLKDMLENIIIFHAKSEKNNHVTKSLTTYSPNNNNKRCRSSDNMPASNTTYLRYCNLIMRVTSIGIFQKLIQVYH